MRRWVYLIGLVVAGVVLVPLATAGAQAPPSTGGETPTVEGSAPPGGNVNCTTGATLSPDHGPPGTEVTVSTTFQGNCDDVLSIFLVGMTCSGSYVLPGNEAVPFPMTVDSLSGDATGTFTAPATEPDPPVVDAVETITVTVTCSTSTPVSPPPSEGLQGDSTTYHYPPESFSLELFANPDGDQPTLVDNDDDGTVDAGVVNGSPTFTG
jgi:hypothetical protein